MKKVIGFLLVFIISAATYAQSVSIGPKVGISRSTITVDGNSNITTGDSSVGFHAGLFAHFSFLGFFVQPEAIFTSTSGEIRINEPGNTQVQAVQELTYNKVDIPIMLGAKVGTIFRVNAGPSFSILLDKDARSEGTVQEIRQDFNRATVGYQIGVGLDINRLMFDLRYENNLSPLGNEISIAGEDFNTDMRNNLYILSLGYKLFK